MLVAGQIVHALATRLTGLTLGAGVFTSRAWPLAEDQLPAWRVIAVDESIEPATVHRDPLQSHALQVELRGHVKATDELDDGLHALTAEALTAVFDPMPPLDALAVLDGKTQLSLRRMERQMATEGEAAIGLVVITLRAEFRTRASAPEQLA
jgi:hypothetical protein